MQNRLKKDKDNVSYNRTKIKLGWIPISKVNATRERNIERRKRKVEEQFTKQLTNQPKLNMNHWNPWLGFSRNTPLPILPEIGKKQKA